VCGVTGVELKSIVFGETSVVFHCIVCVEACLDF